MTKSTIFSTYIDFTNNYFFVKNFPKVSTTLVLRRYLSKKEYVYDNLVLDLDRSRSSQNDDNNIAKSE